MDKTNIDFPVRPREVFLETKEIAIEGMTCNECVRTIEKALKGRKGVQAVKIDRQRSVASVTYDSRHTNMPALHDLLLASGYRPRATADDSSGEEETT